MYGCGILPVIVLTSWTAVAQSSPAAARSLFCSFCFEYSVLLLHALHVPSLIKSPTLLCCTELLTVFSDCCLVERTSHGSLKVWGLLLDYLRSWMLDVPEWGQSFLCFSLPLGPGRDTTLFYVGQRQSNFTSTILIIFNVRWLSDDIIIGRH